MEHRFKREIVSLSKIFEFIGSFAEANALNDANIFLMNFVVEEVFTNMVKYNPKSDHDILIGVERQNNKLVITLTDFDTEPFDLTKTGDVDIHQSLKERKVGGLGIHLARKMVDTVDYEYKDRQSKVTLTKTLEK